MKKETPAKITEAKPPTRCFEGVTDPHVKHDKWKKTVIVSEEGDTYVEYSSY